MEPVRKKIVCDVVILGNGPSALIAAMDLARPDFKILVVGQDDLSGSAIAGDISLCEYALTDTIRKILGEFRIDYDSAVDHCAAAASNMYLKLMEAARAGGAEILSAPVFEDLVCAESVEGVILALPDKSGSPAQASVRADVLELNCPVVLDTIGASGQVYQAIKDRSAPGQKVISQQRVCPGNEEILMERSGSIYPGLFVAGRAAAAMCGLPESGLSLEGLLLSGRKAAQDAELFLAENFILPPKRHKY